MFWDESWNIDFINVFGLRIISLIFWGEFSSEYHFIHIIEYVRYKLSGN